MKPISCIISAFNEGPRIGAVLEVAAPHGLLDEVIVVDDGSSDDTSCIAATFPEVTLLRHRENRGKSAAVATAVRAARGDYLMLLDADLQNLTAADITDLARPVLDGVAGMSISLRGNSAAFFKLLGLDFISGERMFPKALLADAIDELDAVSGFGVEALINRIAIRKSLPIAVVDWPSVRHALKVRKFGWREGSLREIRMLWELLSIIPPAEAACQIYCLRRQVIRRYRQEPCDLSAGHLSDAYIESEH